MARFRPALLMAVLAGFSTIALVYELAGVSGPVATGKNNVVMDVVFLQAFTDDDDALDDARRDGGDDGTCPDLGGVDQAPPGFANKDPADGLSSCDPAAGEDGLPDDAPGGPGGEARFDKDVARCDAALANASEEAWLAVTNGYPGYFCTGWFAFASAETVQATIAGLSITDGMGGAIVEEAVPSTTYRLDLTGDGRPDLGLHIDGFAVGQAVIPHQTVWMVLDVQVLQDAPQIASMLFGVNLRFGGPPSPYCVQSGECFTVEYWGATDNNDGSWSLEFRVTNACKYNVSYLAFGIDDWRRISPTDDGNSHSADYSGLLGPYNVVWTGEHGNPGFPSIKFETLFADGFANGASDTFTIIVAEFDPSIPIMIQGHAGKVTERFIFQLDRPPACEPES
jgi:hypothetical protein